MQTLSVCPEVYISEAPFKFTDFTELHFVWQNALLCLVIVNILMHDAALHVKSVFVIVVKL